MPKVEKKHLGKRIGSLYVVGKVSLREYQNGYEIKPYGQEPIKITKEIGHTIADLLRNKNRLFTYEEAKKIFLKMGAESL